MHYVTTHNAREYDNFWTPITIEDDAPQKNVLLRALLNIGEYADAYVSTSSKSIEFHSRTEMVQWENGQKLSSRIWLPYETTADNTQLKFLAIKIVKVITYLLVLPLIIGLLAKGIYRQVVVNPFVSNLKTIGIHQIAFEPEAKRALIASLPKWLEDHFPEQRDEFKKIWAKFYLEAQSLQESQVDQKYRELREKIIEALSGNHDKTALIMRGLTLPKENAPLRLVAEDILFQAWNRIVQLNNREQYAWCNATLFSYDSYQILQKVLMDQPQKMKVEAPGKKLYPRLDFSLMGPAFSIGVSAPQV